VSGKEIVYHQILEAVRWYARNSELNVTEILNQLESDVLSGRYEKKELSDELRFWKCKDG